MSVSYNKKVVFLVQEEGEAPREATPQDFVKAGFVPSEIHSHREEKSAEEEAGYTAPNDAKFFGEGNEAGFCVGFGMTPESPAVFGFLGDLVEDVFSGVEAFFDFLENPADKDAAEDKGAQEPASAPTAEEKPEPTAKEETASTDAEGEGSLTAEEREAINVMKEFGVSEEDARAALGVAADLGRQFKSLLPDEKAVRDLRDLFKGKPLS